MSFHGRGVIAVSLLAVGVGMVASAPFGLSATADEMEERIAALIQQLGDQEYSVRERAQRELLKLGAAAFDALNDAEKSSSDIEIASRAKYLVRLIRVEWVQEGDPQAIKQILKEYDFQNQAARLERMRQLADLPDGSGIVWLCRLARFESSAVLSKHAAAMAMNIDPPAEETAWQKRAESIRAELDRSRRPAALWLRTYLATHDNLQQALEEWISWTALEQKALQETPQQSHYQLVQELLRQQVTILEGLGKTEQALAAMRSMVDVERGEENSLSDLVGYLAQHKAWGVVDLLSARFAARFDADPMLLYSLAQARSAQGDEQRAEETAQKAFHVPSSLPASEAADAHLQTARNLVERGLVRWAEQEFRHVISLGRSEMERSLTARFWLASMLHDQLRHQEAAEALQGFVDAMDADRGVLQWVQSLHMDPGATRARALFYSAKHLLETGDRAKALEQLDKAIAVCPTDGDVLIELYRLSDQDQQRRAKDLELIKKAANEFRRQIEETPDESTPYNQWAWLIANTEGDVDEAIRMSHKSIELERATSNRRVRQRILSGHLDTLAHCYFAKRDYASAVKYQSEAARLDPHSPPIDRQLKTFRQALKTQQSGKAAEGN